MPALLADDYRQESLWQSQVTMPNAAHGELPHRADVVVIGAGYCGLAAATSAAAAGASVMVFDAEPLGWGASSRNGGMVIPELKLPPQSLANKIGPLAFRLYDELEEAFAFVESAAVGSDYTRSGQLLLAHSPRHLAELKVLADQIPTVTYLDTHQTRALMGNDVFAGAALFTDVGGLHPAKFHAALAQAALAVDVSIHDRTAVTGVQRVGADGFEVHTTRGVVGAGEVIVATNAYADDAVPEVAAQVLPINSFIIATEPLPADVRVAIPTQMMVDTRHLLHYWRLSPDGRMVFGGRRSLEPVDVPVARDYLYDQMVRFHPVLAGVAVQYAWTGHVAMTVDRLPHVGTVDGAWFATGCNGSGVCLNTWLGHRLGLVVTGAAPPPAFAELPSPRIPLKSMAPVYLPLVGRYYAIADRR